MKMTLIHDHSYSLFVQALRLSTGLGYSITSKWTESRMVRAMIALKDESIRRAHYYFIHILLPSLERHEVLYIHN